MTTLKTPKSICTVHVDFPYCVNTALIAIVG